MTRHLFPLGLLLVLAVALAACASASGSDPLAGTQWVLQSLDGKDQVGAAVGGKDITLNFDQEQQVGGSAGCNSYGGNYALGAAEDSVTFDQLISTLMACMDSNVMEIENQYLNALGTASSYTRSGDTLTITGDGHTLVFGRN